jgi:ATP-dependent Clp protease ATP-binding subunit ClpC
LDKFTEKALEIIETAKDIARELGHSCVATEHLLCSILKVESVAQQILLGQNINDYDVEEKIIELVGSDNPLAKKPNIFTPRTKRVLESSIQESIKLGLDSFVGSEHILLALIREVDSIAVRILIELGVNTQSLYDNITLMLKEQNGAGYGSGKKKFIRSNTPMLDKFSKDLTEVASSHGFDPIIGRHKEMNMIMQILTRRTKNNPCLIGDPGVGKTAIVEYLAQMIQKGEVPEILKNKRVVSFDISSLVAGSKFRGEFEERIKVAINEVKKAKDVILFIDELHTIIGAGNAEGAVDAANILKPSLARGELQIIGATTIKEYRKHIEKDAALERRFQPVKVNEPSTEDAIAMLFGIRDKYEAHHSVKITDKAIEAAVKLSARYITDRFLPDKAIDLIDEAAAHERLVGCTAPIEITKLEDKLKNLIKEKESAIKLEDFERAGNIKKEEEKTKKEIDSKRNKWKNENNIHEFQVGEEEIAKVVSDWTGVNVSQLTKNESERLKNLEKILHERIIGQDEAVTAIAKTIRRGRVGLKNPKRPIGTFLFLGPTGVGKTELSRALSKFLFDDEEAVIRIDMSEYHDRWQATKLIGSSPGYVGYEEGGQLTEKVRRKPYSVILFDEIEKAHPDIFNVLLQLLDDGRLTDARGRTADFKNTIIIMTSNVGAKSIISPKKLGFSTDDDKEKSYEEMKKNIMSEVKELFKPEFLNRIDEIIVFRPISHEDSKKIVNIMFQEVKDRVKESFNTEIEFNDDVVEFIIKKGFDQNYGARPLRRTIQTEIENSLSEIILEKKIDVNKKIIVDIIDNNINFRND